MVRVEQALKTCGTGLPFHTKNTRRIVSNSPHQRRESDVKDINGGSVVRVCLVFPREGTRLNPNI